MKSEIEKILATHLDYPDVTIVEKLLRPFIYKVVDKRDNQIKDMIDAEIELYAGIIKSTEDKPTKMAFEGSVLALDKIRSKL